MVAVFLVIGRRTICSRLALLTDVIYAQLIVSILNDTTLLLSNRFLLAKKLFQSHTSQLKDFEQKHHSKCCKTITQVRSVLFCSIDRFQFLSDNQYQRRLMKLNGMSLDYETNMALLSYLSGSQLKKRMVHECDFIDTD